MRKFNSKIEKEGMENFPDYPLYPASEDIFHKNIIEKEINPEDILKTKAPNESSKNGANNEKDFTNDKSGNDLDIPGSELDDEQENIGSEDEENNYYSLGGDDHDNLDEDNG
jgi:hypothetical protein